MQIAYINLDSAERRRSAMEENFSRCCPVADWRLRGFAAADQRYIEANRVEGTLGAGAKGCFLSHKLLLKGAIGDDQDLFILEDDTLLSPKTFLYLPPILQDLRDKEWDLLFTDITVVDIATMIGFFKMRRALAGTGEVTLCDLSRTLFAGSAAYVVNGRSKAKFSRLLERTTVYDAPYDLVLRQLVYDGELKAYASFPFLTTVSGLGDSSQIVPQAGQLSDLVWSAFRRLVWIDRSPEESRPSLQKIEALFVDDETRMFGAILMAMVSPDYVPR